MLFMTDFRNTPWELDILASFEMTNGELLSLWYISWMLFVTFTKPASLLDCLGQSLRGPTRTVWRQLRKVNHNETDFLISKLKANQALEIHLQVNIANSVSMPGLAHLASQRPADIATWDETRSAEKWVHAHEDHSLTQTCIWRYCQCIERRCEHGLYDSRTTLQLLPHFISWHHYNLGHP